MNFAQKYKAKRNANLVATIFGSGRNKISNGIYNLGQEFEGPKFSKKHIHFAQNISPSERKSPLSKNAFNQEALDTVDFEGVKIVPRSAWAQYSPDLTGPDPLEVDRTPNSPYNRVTLHHAGRHSTPQSVERLHRGRNFLGKQARKLFGKRIYNYADVGYDFMISEDGTIFQGRNLMYEGSHVRSQNTDNIGISFLGNYSKRPLKEAQVTSYKRLIDALNSRFSPQNSKLPVYTHGYYQPEKDAELRGAVNQLIPLGVVFDQPLGTK